MGDKPLRILLLEDDDDDACLLERMLKQMGAALAELNRAKCLREALALLTAKERFDVILSDLSVPDSHGLATVAKIHAQVPELPMVVLSGLADETVAIQAVQTGAQDYLIKGQVSGPLLSRALRYAIERDRCRLIAELQEALAKVRVLRGLLPICAWCRKIRNDQGYWNELETHFKENTDVMVTHGICPGCISTALGEQPSQALTKVG